MEEKDLIETYKKLIKEYKEIEDDFKDLDSRIRKGSLSSEQRSEFCEDLKYDREELERISILIDRLEKENVIIEYNGRNTL